MDYSHTKYFCDQNYLSDDHCSFYFYKVTSCVVQHLGLLKNLRILDIEGTKFLPSALDGDIRFQIVPGIFLDLWIYRHLEFPIKGIK